MVYNKQWRVDMKAREEFEYLYLKIYTRLHRRRLLEEARKNNPITKIKPAWFNKAGERMTETEMQKLR